MRVRIGVCLLALCWPLLLTAAPVLVSSAPAHACCRRGGEHHCAKPASSDTSVSAICPQAGHRLKFAGPKSGRPAVLVPLAGLVTADAIVPLPTIRRAQNNLRVRSSRAPPIA